MNKKQLMFGTIDSFLIWRLTKRRIHATDATNASRTMLYNISTNEWDKQILKMLKIPREILPIVKDCSADFGHTDPSLTGSSYPITGIVGDQQSASLGQLCLKKGMIKATYGTGCFVLINTDKNRYKRHVPQTWSPDLVPRLGTPSDSPDPPLRSTPRQQEWLQCESPGESEKGLNPDLAGCLIKL